MALKRLLFLRKVQVELSPYPAHRTVTPILFGDNEKSIHVAHTGQYEGRTSHMELRFYALSERVRTKQVELVHVRRDENPSDLLTHINTPNVDWVRHISAIVR